MKYRKIPNTDLNVSETGLGTWTLVSNRWGSLSEESSIKLVHTALDLGINLFDTADQYGSGNNEEVVAKALKGQRNNVVLCTKAGYDFYTFAARIRYRENPQNFDPDFIRSACEKSLRRLDTDWIDIYQLHNPQLAVIETEEVLYVLEQLKQEGKIRYYGVVLGSGLGWIEEGKAAIKTGKVNTVQIVYSILEQNPATDFFPIAKQYGTGLFARAPHANGLLDGTVNKGTVFPETGYQSCQDREWLDASLKKVAKVGFLLEKSNITIGQLALKFSLAQETISSVLLTVTNPAQLEEFTRAPDLPDLDEGELEQVYGLHARNFDIT